MDGYVGRMFQAYLMVGMAGCLVAREAKAGWMRDKLFVGIVKRSI